MHTSLQVFLHLKMLKNVVRNSQFDLIKLSKFEFTHE